MGQIVDAYYERLAALATPSRLLVIHAIQPPVARGGEATDLGQLYIWIGEVVEQGRDGQLLQEIHRQELMDSWFENMWAMLDDDDDMDAPEPPVGDFVV